MKIQVTKDLVKIIEDNQLHDGEYKVNKCVFDLSEEYDGLVNKAVFICELGTAYKMDIVNNECDIPVEILKNGEKVKIGVYGYELLNDELVERYSPTPAIKRIVEGSYVANAENSEGGTPTEYEQLESRVNGGLNDIAEAVQNAENLDIDVTKENKTTTVTITKQDGTTKSENVNDGEDGVGLQYNWNGTNLGVKREDEANYNYVNLKGDTGEPGQIEFIVVNELPQTGNEGTIYLVPLDTPESEENNYAEYIYVDGEWELLGKIGVHVDLTNYYTKQEVNNLLPTNLSDLASDSTHRTVTDTEKSTWNNKLDDEDLTDYVKNTDYASGSKGGVIKNGYNTSTDVNGYLYVQNRTYAQYQTDSIYGFISKGTLENVITGKDLTTKAYVDGLVGDINTILTALTTGNGV